MKTPEPRKGMPSPELSREDFTARYLSRFVDPAFRPLQDELELIAAVAWEAYIESRKSPVTCKAGPGYADPDYELSVDWINAKAMIDEAKARFNDADGPPRALVINGSSRSEHTCPGEMSKSFRLARIAEDTLKEAGVETSCWTCRGWRRNSGGRFTPARPASRPRRRCATGRAVATRTIRWVRSTTG